MAARTAIDMQELRERVRRLSPLPPEKTAKILETHFTTPRVIIPYLASRYAFSERKVLEIGSSYGMHLFHWGAGSEGVEAREDAVAFTTALGFPTHSINVEDDLGKLPAGAYEGIHTYNLLEHLVAPHMFLVRCYNLLSDDGLLVIGHPVVPPGGSRQLWSAMGLSGWMAGEHINFFTPETARLTLERAGFEVLEQLSPGFMRIARVLSRLVLPLGVGCYSVCRKRPGFRYAGKRIAAFDPVYGRDELAVFRRPAGS